MRRVRHSQSKHVLVLVLPSSPRYSLLRRPRARPLSLSPSVYLERCLILHIYPQLVPRPPQRTVWVTRLLGVTLSEVEHKSGHERWAVAVSLVVKGTGGGPAAKARPIKAEGHDE